MELNTELPRKRRVVDTSNGEARRAVQATLAQFNAWRLDLARFAALAERRSDETGRAKMLQRCGEIERELLEARTELIIGLANSPRKVSGNSRVVDVERALDNVEAGLTRLRSQLVDQARMSP
jgi:hypothetical protein